MTAAAAAHEHRTPTSKPLSLDDRGFTWPCTVCANPIHEVDGFVGEWSCDRCDWKAVAWCVCSQRCMDLLWMRAR